MAEIKSLFDRDEFKPFKAQWDRRQSELARRHDYYTGEVYNRHKYRFGWWLGQRLYRGIRPLFLPFARAVDVDAGIIPGGWAFKQEAPDAWRTARKQLFAWSEWATQGVLYVHYGAIFGVSGLKVADLRDEKKVVIAPVDPRTFTLVRAGGYSQAPVMAITLEQREGADGTPYEYAEVITAQEIMTFRNGQPEGYEGRPERYPNALGAVPIIEVRHIETGTALGECTFQKAMMILDELNELGSYLADIIKKHAEPQNVVTGAAKSELKKGDNVWFLPEGAKVDSLIAEIDIAGVQGFLTQLSDNVHEALPESAFDELKSKAEIATATLELQLQELVLKVKRARPNYDSGLIKALRLAGKAAADMGLSDVAPLDDEMLELDNERPVLRADLDTREMADYLLKSGAPNEKVWEALGVEQDEIAEWRRILDERQARFNVALDSDGETAL